jgi:hypothetical protein
MGGFNLSEDFQIDPEALFRRARASLIPPRRNPPPIRLNPPPTESVYLEISTEPIFSELPPTEPICPSSIASTSFGASVKEIRDYSLPPLSNVAIWS